MAQGRDRLGGVTLGANLDEDGLPRTLGKWVIRGPGGRDQGKRQEQERGTINL